MPEQTSTVDLPEEWKQTADGSSRKQFVDGDDPRLDASVTFSKSNGAWSYRFAPAGTKPTSDSAKRVTTGDELFLDALRDAEVVVSHEMD